ncbi:orotidine-5'-phosphate decarboxylase [Brevibacterium linens]|uniref:Orotidine 5'-phosphate decarboxylase n=1 Tax=Brevibacterium linens ATCC 9172 TaxID=1255617 RepID=A0A2H1HK91_BRELN|nr:orotidine-5'-phosphate decarboxylase [Brevibacterium linens]KAB1949569.1 orotidine-5'-phosphate decarboxylase [Brevibacterium linens ATCC 9172]SMX63353.1 orotidine-5'-phosphate decarboxylase [Brevibacterium linens ATCC 9172]
MFGTRLAAAMEQHGPLCVGIDPHEHLLASWGLPASAAGVREFALRTVGQLKGSVAAVKPQSAFFEQYGSAGVAALEETLAAAKDAGLLTVLDIKRGDIGSTMGAYARAYLDPASALAADSITVSPYLGFGALEPAFELAAAHGKGIFVLALTSNPEGAEVQHAVRDGESVAAAIVSRVRQRNARALESADELGSFGLVVGATIGTAAADLGFDPSDCGGPILAPGVGAQGAGLAELRAVFGDRALSSGQVLATASRAVLGAGPDGLADAAAALNRDLRAAD